MATPSPATNLPTRQQLDEIDALLRRMLTLPPLPGEPAEPPPEPVAPAITYPAPTIREVQPPRDPLPAEPVVREWRVEWPQAASAPPPSPPPAPSVVAWGSPVVAIPAVVSPAPQPIPFPTAPAYAHPAICESVPFAAAVSIPATYVVGQPPPSTVQPPSALPIQLLVFVNGMFNVLTYLVGPLGTWLRGPGRNTVGWCGILMILAAGAWAAGEWIGYEWPAIDLTRFGGPTIRR
jgi:hypothetical protein